MSLSQKNLVNEKPDHAPQTSEQTLVLGSSLLRYLDETRLDNTQVSCLPGGKIADINCELRALRSTGSRFSKVIILAGRNDAAPIDMDLKAITEVFRSAIGAAKIISNSVTVAEIPPRLKPANALGNIHRLNRNIKNICDELEVIFAPNKSHFYMGDETVNEGYLYDDVHSCKRIAQTC